MIILACLSIKIKLKPKTFDIYHITIIICNHKTNVHHMYFILRHYKLLFKIYLFHK